MKKNLTYIFILSILFIVGFFISKLYLDLITSIFKTHEILIFKLTDTFYFKIIIGTLFLFHGIITLFIVEMYYKISNINLNYFKQILLLLIIVGLSTLNIYVHLIKMFNKLPVSIQKINFLNFFVKDFNLILSGLISGIIIAGITSLVYIFKENIVKNEK
jgi:hypothetical protein